MAGVGPLPFHPRSSTEKLLTGYLAPGDALLTNTRLARVFVPMFLNPRTGC